MKHLLLACTLALVGCARVIVVSPDASPADDAQVADAGNDGGVTDPDAGSDAGPPVLLGQVCTAISEDSERLGCGIMCPTRWATVCRGPHADWCLQALQLQIANCAELAAEIGPGGECDTACGAP